MIQIAKDSIQIVKVRMNPEKVVLNNPINFNLSSPSRPNLNFLKTLTQVSSGIYIFEMSEIDTQQLIDDTYFYDIIQGDLTLKSGVISVTLLDDKLSIFDYTLDLTLA